MQAEPNSELPASMAPTEEPTIEEVSKEGVQIRTTAEPRGDANQPEPAAPTAQPSGEAAAAPASGGDAQPSPGTETPVAPAPEAAPIPIEQQTPEQLTETLNAWLQVPETLRGPIPKTEMFVALALARDKMRTKMLELQKNFATQSPEEILAAADDIIKTTGLWKGLDAGINQLSLRLDALNERNLSPEIRTATTEAAADAATLPRYETTDPDKVEKEKRDRTRLDKIKDTVVGAAGTTLRKMWHLNDGASMSTLLDFLIKGAERGYGANNWNETEAPEVKEKLVDRSIFKEMLQNRPAEFALMLHRACITSGDKPSLMTIGWQLTTAEQSELEELSRTTDVTKLKEKLPAFMEKLNNFFADDTERGRRWQKARPILAEALPDSKGKDKMLPDASGLDLYASVNEKWWTHWK